MKDYSKHGLTEIMMHLLTTDVTEEEIFRSLIANYKKRDNKTAFKKLAAFMNKYDVTCCLGIDDMELLRDGQYYEGNDWYSSLQDKYERARFG